MAIPVEPVSMVNPLIVLPAIATSMQSGMIVVAPSETEFRAPSV